MLSYYPTKFRHSGNYNADFSPAGETKSEVGSNWVIVLMDLKTSVQILTGYIVTSPKQFISKTPPKNLLG